MRQNAHHGLRQLVGHKFLNSVQRYLDIAATAEPRSLSPYPAGDVPAAHSASDANIGSNSVGEK